jgi:arylsulfatase A-like enzyme
MLPRTPWCQQALTLGFPSDKMRRMALPRALAARGALAGALGGLAAGALDFLLASSRAALFLPTGRWRLALFLCCLYAAAAAAIGALTGLFAGAIGAATDAGPMWRIAFEREEERPGARVAAYLAALFACAAGIGLALKPIVFDALQRFHHHGLIAALVGAAAAALALASLVAIPMLAAALSLALRFGPRVRLRFKAPPALVLAAWTLGLLAGAGAVAALLLSLQSRARMGHVHKALNVSLWAPGILMVALTVAHLGARLAGRFRSQTHGWTWSPAGAAAAIAACLALPMVAVCAASWVTVKQLDLRPFAALAVALVVSLAVALAGVGRALGQLTRTRRLAFALLLVACPALLTASSAKYDRVRKAAIQFSGITGPVVRAVHAAADFDRDGYASLLGGGDCNDLDREVHPGAFDWPDDGIDQDCNGHEATLTAPRPRAWIAPPATLPKDANVILITIDALRADHLGCYGYTLRPTTPRIDALAKESIRFARGWAHAPSTRYSVPAILTGRYPSTIAVGNANWPPNVLPENRLVPEILKERGYHTGANLPYHYFARSWGLDQGFDDYDVHLQTLHSMGGDPAKTAGSSARQLTDLNIEWVRKNKGGKFFLWTHYYDTHFMFEKHPDVPESNFGDDELAMYDGEIRFTDFQLGRLFDALKQEGLWENTIIIITADHGEGFGEHGLPPNRRHGYHLYRNQTEVPFIMRVPGLAPRVVDEPVGHVDLLPTLLNTLGAPADAEPQLLGDSMLALMLGQKEPANRRVFQEVWYEGPTSRKALVTAGWHLILNLIPDDTSELYDLTADPLEEHDVAGGGGKVERGLRGELAAWMDSIALPTDFRRKVEGNLSSAALPFTTALGDTLGGWLKIEGVDVSPPTAKAGDTVEVSLILHGLAPVPPGWRLFTHFIGSDGRRINADHEPLEGLYPVGRIKPGQWLRDRVRVTLPAAWPAGPLAVDVGLWRREGRAPARGPHSQADAVRAATVQITK